jgi:hypothetical protein
MMLTENYQPEIEIYNCKSCNYKCYDKSNFNKHLTTKKHIKTTTGNTKTTTKTTCECECGKKYRHSASLSRHKLNCKKNERSELENQYSKEDIMKLITQNRDLMTLMSSQQQQHREETKCLVETIHEQSVTIQQTIKGIIPSIGNNNNNTTNNNQFNLQVFLNEDCKDALNFSEFIEKIQISFDDLENQAENGYVKGISKLFIENLQKLGINKRPIHCTDKKRKTLYIKENDTWDKEGSLDSLKNGIQEVTRRTYCELMKSKAENKEEYRDADSVFSCKCLTIQQNLTPAYPRETSIGKVIEKITQNTGIIEK